MESPKKRKPLHDALIESIATIDLTFSATQPSFKHDRFQTAQGREKSVTEFLKSYFPNDWTVKKGPIYDTHGNVSAEIDCVLCVPQHPPCHTPTRDLILAEGVHAAIEVKPDIRSLSSSGEFWRGLEQISTVKSLRRTINSVNRVVRESWPAGAHAIPCVIFAKHLADLEESTKFMIDYKKEQSRTPWDGPDIVFGYEAGIIYHAPRADTCSLSNLLQRLGLSSGDEGYLLIPTAKEEGLVLFLTLLYSHITPQPLLSRPILEEYLLPVELPEGAKLLRAK